MKKMLAVSLLALCLSTTVKAGDVPFPPLPPPCTQDCAMTTGEEEVITISPIIFEFVVRLVTFRP